MHVVSLDVGVCVGVGAWACVVCSVHCIYISLLQ